MRCGRLLTASAFVACVLGLALVTLHIKPLRASESAAWAALRTDGVVLFRHSNAPGTGDPARFKLGDCTTQRNLDEAGRQQARRIGAAFQQQGIVVGLVLTSRWCRAQDTANLAFPGKVQLEPTFDSFFDDRARGPAQTASARGILTNWNGPGALVITTHQVNITALTGIVPASGEGVVLVRDGNALRIAGRIRP
jgi:phosphohistidine phosphatase SixA